MRQFFAILFAMLMSAMMLGMIGCSDAEQPTTDNSDQASDEAEAASDYATNTYAAVGDCYAPTSSRVDPGPEYIFWFRRRPPSYDAYLWWVKVRADWFPPHNPNGTGVTIQKRDMIWCCALSTRIAMRALRLCEK